MAGNKNNRPLPKFGEWDVNDPSSAESFSVIFNKARNERKSGAKLDSPPLISSAKFNHQTQAVLGKSHYKKWFCCINTSAE